MEKRKIQIFLFSAFFTMSLIGHIITELISNDLKQKENEFFNEFPLTTYGTICNVKKKDAPQRFFVTVKVDSSNFEVYKQKSPSFEAYFAVQAENTLVFIDHYDHYNPGDKICIGCGNNSITLMHQDGMLKFAKKRSETMLFNISSPNKELLKQLELGCR